MAAPNVARLQLANRGFCPAQVATYAGPALPTPIWSLDLDGQAELTNEGVLTEVPAGGANLSEFVPGRAGLAMRPKGVYLKTAAASVGTAPSTVDYGLDW